MSRCRCGAVVDFAITTDGTRVALSKRVRQVAIPVKGGRRKFVRGREVHACPRVLMKQRGVRGLDAS